MNDRSYTDEAETNGNSKLPRTNEGDAGPSSCYLVARRE